MRISGGFWGRFQALNREVTIPHGMRMLVESGSLENLRLAAAARQDGPAPRSIRCRCSATRTCSSCWRRSPGSAGAAATTRRSGSGHRVTALMLPGLAWPARRDGEWPYRAHPARPPANGVTLPALPFYAWANRGPSEMRVWLPEQG
jgi:hypothetical protein